MADNIESLEPIRIDETGRVDLTYSQVAAIAVAALRGLSRYKCSKQDALKWVTIPGCYPLHPSRKVLVRIWFLLTEEQRRTVIEELCRLEREVMNK